MKIYLISGLGADYRAFEKLTFPSGFEIIHLAWINALPDESLENYSRRMAEKINTGEPFILGGLSFGGIVAVEISKFISPKKLILFSTVGSRKELPWYYRLSGNLKLYKLLPKAPMQPFLPFLFWFFGPLDKPGRDVLRYFARLSKPYFLKWALTKISTWNNTVRPANVFQIHGDRDRAFPLKYLPAPDHVVRGAGHMALYTHGEEVTEVLTRLLQDVRT